MHLTPQMTQLLMLLFVAMVVILIGAFFATMLFIKFMTRGKVAIVFFESRRIYSMLLPEDAANKCVWLGKEDNPNREKYSLVPDKVFEIRWPSGMVPLLQERLRAWVFSRNNDEPWDPSNMRVTMSARMNRMISDESLLRTMWRDLRQSVGAGQVAAGRLPMMQILFLAFIALLAGLGMVLTWGVNGKVTEMYALLQHLYQALVAAKLIQP